MFATAAPIVVIYERKHFTGILLEHKKARATKGNPLSGSDPPEVEL